MLTQHLDEIGEGDWDRCFAVHVKAPFFLLRTLRDRLPAGASVMLVGTAAARRASPENHVYGAIKAALAAMLASMAVALAPSGLRVNVAAPGLIGNRVQRGQHAVAERDVRPERRGDRQVRVSGIPLGRATTAEEVAAAISSLASPESSYVTARPSWSAAAYFREACGMSRGKSAGNFAVELCRQGKEAPAHPHELERRKVSSPLGL